MEEYGLEEIRQWLIRLTKETDRCTLAIPIQQGEKLTGREKLNDQDKPAEDYRPTEDYFHCYFKRVFNRETGDYVCEYNGEQSHVICFDSDGPWCIPHLMAVETLKRYIAAAKFVYGGNLSIARLGELYERDSSIIFKDPSEVS